MKTSPAIVCTCLSLLASCGTFYQPVQFVARDDQIIATGTIDETTLAAFEKVVARNPDIRTLVLLNIEGSADDDTNVVFSRAVHDAGFDIIVPSNGLIASGGTDLFLAGKRRILQPGACVGVHSWSGAGIVATEIPPTDPEHDRYLDYFRDVGAPEEFYWFTLAAAPAEGMHWMTAAETELFGMTTDTAPRLGSAEVCDNR